MDPSTVKYGIYKDANHCICTHVHIHIHVQLTVLITKGNSIVERLKVGVKSMTLGVITDHVFVGARWRLAIGGIRQDSL